MLIKKPLKILKKISKKFADLQYPILENKTIISLFFIPIFIL